MYICIYIYIYIYVYTYISCTILHKSGTFCHTSQKFQNGVEWRSAWYYKAAKMHRMPCPPDAIKYLCSLTGVFISQKYFTHRSVQIFKMLFQGFYAPGSDLPHKIMWYWFYSSILLSRWFWSGGNVLYQACTIYEWANRRGWPLNILHIHRVGRLYTLFSAKEPNKWLFCGKRPGTQAWGILSILATLHYRSHLEVSIFS